MKDFNDIERIFNREKRAFWVLYDAKGKRRSCTPDSIMKMSDAKERLAESFKFLEEVLEDEGDGVYKIQLRTSENAGKQQIENTFQYGEYVEPVAPVSRTERSAPAKPANQGIAGLNSIAGFEFINGLMQNGRSEADRLRDEKNELKLELMEKKFQIAGLEAQVNAPPQTDNGWNDIIKGVFQDHSDIIIDRLLPEGDKTTKIATLRSRRPIEVEKPRKKQPQNQETKRDAPRATATEGVKTKETKETAKTPQARMTAIFEDMAAHFPDDNPLDVLERLDPIFDDVTDLFPDDDPLDVLTVVLKMARSKMGKTMIVPMVQKELNRLAEQRDADADQGDDEDDYDDDEEGDGDDD